MKLIQVTDCHMRAAEDTIHWGYRPQASLAAVLDAAAAAHSDADMVLVTGDCVHAYPLDEGYEPEGEDAYRLLRGLVEARFAAASVRAVPGNHDSRAALSAVFPESLGGGAAPAPPEGLHCFAELCEGWLVLGCDSQSGDPLDPASEGDMSPPQLAWVRSVVSTPPSPPPPPCATPLRSPAVRCRQLAAHPGTPAIICLHHPPIEGTESFTDSGARDIEALVAGNAQVKAVVAGHIHHDYNAFLGDVPLLATPSCVFQ